MNTPAKNVSPLKGKKRERKVSDVRKAAESALANAKSDQEKSLARSHVKVVRFQEIVVPRVNRALSILGQIEKMTNPNAYTWTDDQAQKILQALAQRLQALADRFARSKKAKETFTL